MAAVPGTHTFVNGIRDSSEENTYIRDPLLFLAKRPMARLRQIVAQTLTTSVYAAITFTTHDVDQDWAGGTGHSDSSNPSRYTANYAGWYLPGGGVYFDANATGYRGCRWAVNGTAVNGSETFAQAVSVGGFGTSLAARSELVFLNVGDYVELQGIQASGGNLLTVASGAAASTMSITWVSN